jgi:hypothetical protein
MLLAGPIAAQEDGRPFARTRLDPGPSVTVGQPLRITVEVLVPSYFTGGPRFSTVNVPDALTLFEDRGTNFTERFGRTTFAGQSRSYVIYPQRPGAFRVDAISVTVPYFDDDAGRTTATVAPPPVAFEAVLPPEAEGLSYFISTTRLSLRANYDPLPDTIRVGDAFTRTITATVDDALAMVVPPFGADSIAGLAVYADPPLVDDQGGERGAQIVGTRAEAVTFVALEEGEYDVPGAELQWWDVNAARMRTETVTPISFVVLPAVTDAAFELAVDSTEAEAAGDTSTRVDLVGLLRRFGPWLLALVAVVWIGARMWRRYGARWMREWQAAKIAKAESEKAYFEKFRAAARKGDPSATLNALMAWYDRARSPSDPAALSDWITAAGDAELAKAYEALLAVGYRAGATTDSWHSGTLLRTVTRARKQRTTPLGRPAGASLPPLNPTAF